MEAILRHMATEEKPDPEARYSQYNDDIRIMRHELNKLSSSVGEMLVAIRGNDLGTTGLIGQIKEMKGRLDGFENRLDNVEAAAQQAKVEAQKRQFYIGVILTLAGTIAGTLLKALIDKFSKK